MTNKSEYWQALLSLLKERYPDLALDEMEELTDIIFDYIQLLSDSRIEEAAHYLRTKYGLLVKII
jgi:hypothetical protein